jgi:ubiquitin C-terminal hydrolase
VPAETEDIDGDFLEDALEMIDEAMQADCTELAARLQNLITEDLSDEEFRSRLEQLKADLPGLAAKVGGGEKTVKAWEAVLAAALGNEVSAEDDED